MELSILWMKGKGYSRLWPKELKFSLIPLLLIFTKLDFLMCPLWHVNRQRAWYKLASFFTLQNIYSIHTYKFLKTLSIVKFGKLYTLTWSLFSWILIFFLVDLWIEVWNMDSWWSQNKFDWGWSEQWVSSWYNWIFCKLNFLFYQKL